MEDCDSLSLSIVCHTVEEGLKHVNDPNMSHNNVQSFPRFGALSTVQNQSRTANNIYIQTLK